MSRRERITAAVSFAGCCVLVMSAAVPVWLRDAPVPAAAAPPAGSRPARPAPGAAGAAVMPVGAGRRVPPRKQPVPAQGSTPAASPVPSSQPQAAAAPPPAVAITLATSPPPCTASLNVLGLGGCLNLGG